MGGSRGAIAPLEIGLTADIERVRAELGVLETRILPLLLPRARAS